MRSTGNRKTFRKEEAFLVAVGVGFVVTLCSLFLFSGFNGLIVAPLGGIEGWMQATFGDALYGNLWSLWTAQLSLTFLSISVLSILSDRDHVIYWKDLVEERLLSPRFGCFAAYTYYSITAAVVSFVGVFFCCATLFLLSFLTNVVVLILLTDSILDVYFSKEKHMRKMRAQLVAAYHQSFQSKHEKRNCAEFIEIMDAFSIQIQRQKMDARYMREVFELMYSNIYLFDTDNTAVQTAVQEVVRSCVQTGALDLRSFAAVVATAEDWTKRMTDGEGTVAYTADWLFWCAASEVWLESEAFGQVHSHSIDIDRLTDLEKLLNRRLRALLICIEKDVLPADWHDYNWPQSRIIYLAKALFGCYVSIYGKRLDRNYRACADGLPAYDQNVIKYFPQDPDLLGKLVAIVDGYGDLRLYLHEYCPQVWDAFRSLMKTTK